MAHEREKQLVSDKAVMLIEDGMKVGIGTGSTVEPFIKSLLHRVQTEGLSITCVCTSHASQTLLGGQVPLLSDSLNELLDISFDGADLFDYKSFISVKGGGGALLREKLVALISKKNIVLIDSSKLASPLKGKVAIEIVSFGFTSTIERLKQLGYSGSLRTSKQKPVLTDNYNFLFDIEYNGPIADPISEHFKLKQISGVVETGFFFKYAHSALVGYPDGTVKLLEK